MSKIKLAYNDKTYILGYTRITARTIEEHGFKLEEISSAPNKMIPLLFQGAFLDKYPKLKRNKIDEIFEKQTNKGALVEALVEMYADTVQTLVGGDEEETDEKNATWEIV